MCRHCKTFIPTFSTEPHRPAPCSDPCARPAACVGRGKEWQLHDLQPHRDTTAASCTLLSAQGPSVPGAASSALEGNEAQPGHRVPSSTRNGTSAVQGNLGRHHGSFLQSHSAYRTPLSPAQPRLRLSVISCFTA